MKKAEEKPRWFYVDETGDPAFYGKGKAFIVGQQGCSKTFSVGFLRTYDPQAIRSKLAEIRLEIMNDRYFKDVPSIEKTLQGFHAKDDCPEVRKLVYAALDRMDFSVQVVVGRKYEQTFRQVYKNSHHRFYSDLVSRLFADQLHLAHENTITFARRGNKAKQHALRAAVEAGVEKFRSKYSGASVTKIKIETNQPVQEPVLQAADYVLWAVQRAFERSEMRYFEYMREKVEKIWDLFNYKKAKQGGSTVYDRRRNPFSIEKASPLS